MRKLVISFVVILFITGQVQAAKGIIVHKGCSYFIVQTDMRFAILKWFGGCIPFKGDVVVGDFENFGMKEIHDVTQNTTITVWVHKFWLSKEQAVEEFLEICPE